MSPIRFAIAVAGLAGAFGATPALSHPRLVSANPAPNATIAAPRALQLRFSERLVGRFSGASLALLGPNSTSVGGLTSRLEADGKTLTIIPRSPLRAGIYRVNWHAVSTDTHRVQGAYAFRVRR